MGFFSWKNVWNFQRYYCKNNEEFFKNISKIPLTSYDSDEIDTINKDIINQDLVESTNQEDELTILYNTNKLITSRMGCVESAFFIKTLNIYMPSHLYRTEDIDYEMKKNAGFYYKDESRKNKIWNWWLKETKELILSETITSCYCFLNYDLILWSAFNLKKKYYNYSNIILLRLL